MKRFLIRVKSVSYATYEIEAENRDKALKLALTMLGPEQDIEWVKEVEV